MIDDFVALPARDGATALWDEARRHANGGSLSRARQKLIACLASPDCEKRIAQRAASMLASVLASLGDARGALSAAWYSGSSDEQRRHVDSAPPVDRARTWLSLARTKGEDAAALHARAAAELESAGLVVRAAHAFEGARDFRAARALWARVARSLRGRDSDQYAAGLAHYNVARTSFELGDPDGARSAVVAAVQALEEAADHFEALGQRERAFDCFQVLVAIGGQSGVFEHTLEGAVNSVRILREDHLHRHAIAILERAVRLAEESAEFAAGASLAKELALYAAREGRERTQRAALASQATLWQRAADAAEARAAPPTLVESALVAAVLALIEGGFERRASQVYARLAALPLDPLEREKYERAAIRLREVTAGDDRLPPRPVEPPLKLPSVWIDDLVEWENAGDAAEVAADVLLDPRELSDSIARRMALVARLNALALDSAPADRATAGRAALARCLGEVELYWVVPPLEKLARDPVPDVRLAALHALGRCAFKRTFVTVERALTDPDPAVQREAIAVIERLRFEHALDPLCRIYRTAAGRDARLAALRAIARLDLDDAARIALDALMYGAADERDAVGDALARSRGPHFNAVAREALRNAPPAPRARIERVLAERGVRDV